MMQYFNILGLLLKAQIEVKDTQGISSVSDAELWNNKKRWTKQDKFYADFVILKQSHLHEGWYKRA